MSKRNQEPPLSDDALGLLSFLADIRKAAGDPQCRLDWPGLIQHIEQLAADAKMYRSIISTSGIKGGQ